MLRVVKRLPVRAVSTALSRASAATLTNVQRASFAATSRAVAARAPSAVYGASGAALRPRLLAAAASRSFSAAADVDYIELTMPSLSPTGSETAVIVKWLVSVGDKVEPGTALAEVETDKAVIAWESSEDGYIAKIFQDAGEVPIGKMVALLVEEEDEIAKVADVTADSAPASSSSAAEPAASSSSAPVEEEDVVPDDGVDAIDLTMPSLSPTGSETAVIVKWLVNVGDKVEPGTALAEVETDKAVIAWESSEEGYIAKIYQDAGEVPIGQTVALLVEEEDEVVKVADRKQPKMGGSASSAPASSASESSSSSSSSSSAPAPSKASGDRVFASPLARKLAGEKGFDVADIAGTGPNARVIAADVSEFKGAQKSASSTASPAASASQGAPAAAAQLSDLGDFTDLPNSQIRKVIARRLVESKQTVPHFYLTTDVNLDKLMATRADFNERAKGEYKVSVNDFVIKASGVALRRMPEVNSQWSDTAIRQFHNVDISVAVDTAHGLMTPVVRDADALGLKEIAAGVKDLATRAKDRKLAPEELAGGTFSISNLGMFGIKQFAAIINPPQAAILAVGAADRRVIVTTDANGNEVFTTANIMTVTLSCDHRVVDGAVAARWLGIFKANMENPMDMLL